MRHTSIFPLFLLVACTGPIRNTNVAPAPNSGGRSAIQANCNPSSLSLDSETPTASVPWLGGVVSYSWGKYEISLENPPQVKETCSSIFEFSKTNDKYSIKMMTSDACTDTIMRTSEATVSVWIDGTATTSGGYVEFRLRNQNIGRYVSILKDTPGFSNEGNPRSSMTDLAYSGQLVPLIQSDVVTFLPEDRAGDAQFFCGDTAKDNDSPTPKSCLWPQGMQSGEYSVDPIAGKSTKADLDALVGKSTELRSRRSTSKSISVDAAKAIGSYLMAWEETQKSSLNVRKWVWLKRVLNNSEYGNGPGCNSTPERRAACARVITKYFLPEKSAFVEKAIQDEFPEETADAFAEEAESSAYAEYTKSLDTLIGKWKAVLSFMSKEKAALRLAANIPTPRSLSEFQTVPLFGTSTEAQTMLKGAHWSFNGSYLGLEFDNNQTILRRPLDSGAVILFGDLPVLSLLHNAPQSDGAGSLVLPTPSKIPGGDCPSK